MPQCHNHHNYPDAPMNSAGQKKYFVAEPAWTRNRHLCLMRDFRAGHKSRQVKSTLSLEAATFSPISAIP